MESLVGPVKKVTLSSLFLDPNNPRLTLDEPRPGYEDTQSLFDASRQPALEKEIEKVYPDVTGLQHAIEKQGWVPIDNIVVWAPPGKHSKYVVVEGNTRVVALRRIREHLERERVKLAKMAGGSKRYAPHDVIALKQLVERLEEIVRDTDQLDVVPLQANNTAEFVKKLRRVLAVRHITGAKGWGNYAEDLWLLERYELLFGQIHKGKKLFWDEALIADVAEEAAISTAKARISLLAASSFSHFKLRFEDELPGGESFEATDYYLFENIARRPWLREQFGLVAGAIRIPDEREDVIKAWVFQLPRGHDADTNPNVFYRHENVVLWDQIHKYDAKHKTAFAARFNVDDPATAPRMTEVEAQYRSHKASSQPVDIIELLLQQLGKIDAETLLSEGEFLRRKLETLEERTQKLLTMIEAAAA